MIAPTREILNGMSQAMRALGVMTVTGLGGFLSSSSVNAPFLLVGCFDIALVVCVALLICLGRLKE